MQYRFIATITKYCFIAGMLIMVVYTAYAISNLNSLHRVKLNRILKVEKITRENLKLVNDSIYRYHLEYSRLDKLTKEFSHSKGDHTSQKLNLLDKTFKEFNKWTDVYPQLGIKKSTLKVQLYQNKQGIAILDRALKGQLALQNTLILIEIILGTIYFIYWYVLNQWFNESLLRIRAKV